MSAHLILMTEESSMGETLRIILAKLFPDRREGIDWIIIEHSGKTDLERSFPRKIRVWGKPNPHFLILRDNDGADCKALKEKLTALVPQTSHPWKIRIVCQELESWFLGDLDAIQTAYPGAKHKLSQKNLHKTEPDSHTNASQLLEELTKTGAKRIRAVEIAQHMNPDKNRSHSFHVFVNSVKQFFQA